MSGEKQIEVIIDLLTEFDEMGFAPTTTVPDPEAYAVKWRDELTKALMDYRKQEWISVEERLPEEKVMVLGFSHTVFKDGGHYDLILVMELKNGLFVPFNCSPIKNGSVTHWMPLPDAPKGE